MVNKIKMEGGEGSEIDHDTINLSLSMTPRNDHITQYIKASVNTIIKVFIAMNKILESSNVQPTD